MEELYVKEERPAEAPAEQIAESPDVPETDAPDGAGTEEELAAWEEFSEAYPEITPENIPEDVFRLISEGETPLHAMRRVELAGLQAENRMLKQKLAAAQMQQRNRVSTPGSMLGRAAAPEDAFLAGLGND